MKTSFGTRTFRFNNIQKEKLLKKPVLNAHHVPEKSEKTRVLTGLTAFRFVRTIREYPLLP